MTTPDRPGSTPDGPELAERARCLLEHARAAETAVDSAAAALFRLGGEVARATTRGEAARSGARVAAERDLMGDLLDELSGIAGDADRLDAELDRRDPEARAVLDAVRGVVHAAGDRGRECEWLGELAADRVHDFAVFELLYSQASRHLDHDDLAAVDAVLPRLVALDRALVSVEIGAMLDELRFRLLISRG